MKQYLSSEQTAKLIELGVEMPKSIEKVTSTEQYGCGYETAYSIGELIEMLPDGINNAGRFEDIQIHPNYHRWVVKYSGFLREPTYLSCMEELIDALYDMIVKLKEEGVI